MKSIMILAPESDETAVSLLRFANSLGYQCTHSWGSDNLTFSVTSDRHNLVSVKFYQQHTEVSFSGVLNLGINPLANQQFKNRAQDPFVHSEMLAGWWSALAYFPGQIINRPCCTGFLPTLNLHVIAKRCPGVHVGDVKLSTKLPGSASHRRTNVNLFRDGSFLGTLEDNTLNLIGRKEVYTLSRFDPSKTQIFLVAGHHAFDLSRENGELEEGWQAKIRPIMQYFDRCSATFALLVVERNSRDELSLVHVSSCPHISLYSGIAEQVHQALLDYLCPGLTVRSGKRKGSEYETLGSA